MAEPQENPVVIKLNTSVFVTSATILMLIEIVLGVICFTVIVYYNYMFGGFVGDEKCTYFLLVSFVTLYATFLMFLSSLFSEYTAEKLRKMLFSVVYHTCACLLYVTASLVLLSSDKKVIFVHENHEAKMVAGGIGVVNALAYFVSSFFAIKDYLLT